MKKKEQKKDKRKKQEEIQVVKIKTITPKTEKSSLWENKTGVVIEVGLIAALTAFSIFCFLTGMDIPVKKLGLSVEIMLLSALFWFTFQTNRGSGYIFSGEFILYGICGFYFRNEIAQGLAAILNIISEKIFYYYNISLPLFQITEHAEQHMKVFLMFATVLIAGITAYVVVNKSARIFLCLILFPIALGCLLVGFLPECLYFLGFLASTAVLLAMPKQRAAYMTGKSVLQSMTTRIAVLVMGCFCFFFGFLQIGMPASRYETIDTIEYKEALQERMQNSFLGKISGFGNGTSVGGLSHGQLGKTEKLTYTGRNCLEVSVSGEIQFPLYLKSYVGERYANDHWETFSDEVRETERKTLGQMRNGEEQGAAWMELFSDMSDWFSEKAFSEYTGGEEYGIEMLDGDMSNDLIDSQVHLVDENETDLYDADVMTEAQSSYYDPDVATDAMRSALSSYYAPDVATDDRRSSLSSYYDSDSAMPDSSNDSRIQDVGDETEFLYNNTAEENKIRSYSYQSIQAILAQKPTTIRVKNIGIAASEKFVPYGRILSKDQISDKVANYTGYPNLNLYVKGGMTGYGYASGNFIKGTLERCLQSRRFLNVCLSRLSKKEQEMVQETDKTIEELITIIKERDGEIYGGEETNAFIKKENGCYKMTDITGDEFGLYLKSGLKVKDAEEYLNKIWKYYNEGLKYDSYVDEYKHSTLYESGLSEICDDFNEKYYSTTSDKGRREDRTLAYIGASINFVTEFLADNMEYSLEPGKLPEGEDFIDYYLFRQKKGYCSHFATIAVNMFRKLGIPARYVEGFVVKPEDVPKNGITKTIQLKDKNAHAWPEIYVEGYGWVPVEVTPGYENGIEESDFYDLLNRMENNTNDKHDNITPTPLPTGTSSKHQTTEQGQAGKNLILDGKTLQWIKTTAIVTLSCGMVILFIWLRYVYTWKKRIHVHSCKRENERVCNYYARMEALLRGIHAIEDADTFRGVLNTYILTGTISREKAVPYITETADKETWMEFVEIVNTAAYSSHDVTGHQLETVRLLSEKMRKEVFAGMPKVKMWYYQYICLL